jgi:6-pyruvoyl-tetrahydropterin synthase
MKIWGSVQRSFIILLAALLMCGSVSQPLNTAQKARYYTAPYEFNYAQWMIDSLLLKLGQSGIAINDHVSSEVQIRVVREYFNLAGKLDYTNYTIEQIYANPNIANPDQAAADKIKKQQDLQTLLGQLGPVVEDILQNQVAEVLADEGIDLGGQSIPPVLYHASPVPKALIISPRNTVHQDADISLLADLSYSQIDKLESQVQDNLGVSALVVDIGGVGVYPTMVMRSSDMHWVIQTIAHEWTHNYLSLHPLGFNYDTNNDLRTMNETTASIVGDEVSQKVIDRFYPEMQTTSSSQTPRALALAGGLQTEAPFDFNTEMHETRVTVDYLLKENRVKAAESYMEARRKTFLQHGYLVRKLNQAYFAFYGAYADVPGGAAGQDPVGPAVRALRTQSGSLADFLKQIAWMNSFSQLQSKVK